MRRAKTELQPDIPVALVANKVDMVHLRQVSAEEGEILAKDFECKFCEVSAAEQVAPVADAFHDLCREVLLARRKSKQSLLDRMLGGTRVYNRGKSDSSLPKDWSSRIGESMRMYALWMFSGNTDSILLRLFWNGYEFNIYLNDFTYICCFIFFGKLDKANILSLYIYVIYII